MFHDLNPPITVVTRQPCIAQLALQEIVSHLNISLGNRLRGLVLVGLNGATIRNLGIVVAKPSQHALTVVDNSEGGEAGGVVASLNAVLLAVARGGKGGLRGRHAVGGLDEELAGDNVDVLEVLVNVEGPGALGVRVVAGAAQRVEAPLGDLALGSEAARGSEGRRSGEEGGDGGLGEEHGEGCYEVVELGLG